MLNKRSFLAVSEGALNDGELEEDVVEVQKNKNPQLVTKAKPVKCEWVTTPSTTVEDSKTSKQTTSLKLK